MNIVVRVIATALATALAAWLIPGITVTGDTDTTKVLTVAGVAVLIGLVNVLVKPVVTILSGCLVILTLGAFLLVINALMLLLVSWLSDKLTIGFNVDGFWPAFFGAIVISVVSALIYELFDRDDDRRRSGRRTERR